MPLPRFPIGKNNNTSWPFGEGKKQEWKTRLITFQLSMNEMIMDSVLTLEISLYKMKR